MGFSLGELFISLGFDVDGTKLDNFRRSLKDTHDEMNRLGKTAGEALGIITGVVGTLSVFTQKAADNALHLSNMKLIFDASTQSAQTFGNAIHQVNSLISPTAGQDMWGQFSQRIRGLIPLTGEGANALNLLGGNYEAGKNMSPETVFENLAASYPQAKQRWGAAYGAWLGKFMDPSAEAAIAFAANNPRGFAAASQYNMTDEGQKNLTDYARSTAEFGEATKRFENTVAVHLAPALTSFFNAITAVLNKLPSDKQMGDFLLDRKDALKEKGFWEGWIYEPLRDAVLSDWHRTTWGRPAASGSVDTRGGRNHNLGNIKFGSFAQRHGATGKDDQGFAIFPDNDMGVSAIAALMTAYGETGRNTIDSIVKSYTKGDSYQTQMAYEAMLSKFTGHGLFDKIDMNNPAEMGKLVAGILRQENGLKIGGLGKVDIHVYSNAKDNQEVARIVMETLQSHINHASAQTNLGGY